MRTIKVERIQTKAPITVKLLSGVDGKPGRDGRDGIDGKDGYTPIKGVDYFDGKDGKDGLNGKDGYTPVKGKDYFDGINGKDGTNGKDGLNGKDATINGVNTLNIVEGTNIKLEQSGNILKINSTGGSSYDDTELREKINKVDSDLGITQQDVQELKNDVDSLEENKANKEDIPDVSDFLTAQEYNNQKYNYVKDGLINNTNTLSDQEKLKIESWLGLAENYLTYYNETPYNVENDYNPTHKKYVDTNIKALDDKVKELELFKFPNMTIVGTPTIQNGQVSNFTLDDYLEFPFLVDFRNRPFEINFAFTTGSNVTVQQNILDSAFGLALAIKNGHTLMAISYNGTTWSNQYTGSLNIEPNTTYVYRINWNGMLYKIQYYNGSEYVNDFYFTSTQQPYPKQMFIGVSKLSNNYFEGSINLNYANLKVDNNIVWSGMDDAGLASRMATDMSNIDAAGTEYINSLIDAKIGNIDILLQDIDTGSGV